MDRIWSFLSCLLFLLLPFLEAIDKSFMAGVLILCS